jgi:hypothetical protein
MQKRSIPYTPLSIKSIPLLPCMSSTGDNYDSIGGAHRRVLMLRGVNLIS